MFTALTIAFLCTTSTNAAHPQDWAKARLNASPRHLEWVTIKRGARSLEAFVAYPEVKTKAPVVIVIHEIMGLTDWVMSVADQLAARGCIAIAPDLLSGHGPNGGRTRDFADVGQVREAISKLDPKAITADLDAVANYGLKLPASNGKLAVAGFCWGGTQSFQFATHRNDLRVAFVFYGSAPTELDALKRITCPVYGFYASNDSRINATLPETEKNMRAAGKKFAPVMYEGAGHGFMRAGEAPDATSENVKARAAAWKRWADLLRSLMSK